jgi:Sulfotransferase family
VETPKTQSFIMCTVPKVACSSFRKLLNAVIRHPDKPAAKTWDQIMSAHFDIYPTVWHYQKRHHNLTTTHPSFILGRNPYVRVLSGFLNKMVMDPTVKEPHDMYTLRDTNRALGRPEDKPFDATKQSFSHFLKLLKQNGAVVRPAPVQ